MSDYGARALAQRKIDNPLTTVANACGHWSGSNPVRHWACRNLPLDKCARPVYGGRSNPDLPKDVIE